MRRAEDEEDEDSRNGATKLCRKVEKNNFRPFFYVLLVSFLLHVTNAAPQDSVLLEILGSQEDSDYQPWESEELEPSFERDSRAALAPKESSAREPNQWERQARTAADSHLLRYTKRNAMPSAGLDFNPEGANHLMRLTGQDGRQGFDADAHLLRFNRAKQEEHWLRFNKRGGEAPAVDQPDPVRQPRYDDHFLRYSRGTDDHLLRYSRTPEELDDDLKPVYGKRSGDSHLLRWSKRSRYGNGRQARGNTDMHLLRYGRSSQRQEVKNIKPRYVRQDDYLLRFN